MSDIDLGFDDMNDFSVNEVEDFITYTPEQRVLMLHRLFVIFCDHRQNNWWDAYVAELIHFFGECGEPPLTVQFTLRKPIVMQRLRPFCF